MEETSLKLTFHPLTPERWLAFSRFFGEQGACGGCWCMWWKLKRSDFLKQKGEENRKALGKLVDSGEVPGILAYVGAEPVGWCAVAPREAYPALARSRVLKCVDGKPVWSIVCFYVAKQFRRKGLTSALLEAALEHAEKHGGTLMEGYPVEPKTAKLPDVFAYTGLRPRFARRASQRSQGAPKRAQSCATQLSGSETECQSL